MNSLQRKGLINGGIAALITFVAGTALVATLGRDDVGSAPVTPTPTASPSPTPECEPSWEVVESEDVPDTPVTLLGVAAIAAGEAWAVGSVGDPLEPSEVEVQRWDGAAWTRVEAPSPGSFINELRGVDASEPNDVWAVGRTSSGFGEQPLVLRYDGTAWLEVPVPEEVDGHLNDVAALSPTDVWAVGSVGDPAASLERALVLHWDGAVWAEVDVHRAIGGGKALLRGIDAISPTDLWVVGYHHNRPLILRFDGQAWSRSETEVLGELVAVEAFASTEVWAVGTPIQLYDGTTWAEVDTPPDAELADVAAVGAQDVWSVGARPASGEVALRAGVARWGGRRWSFVEGPGVPGSDVLSSIDALPDGTVLAVGWRDTQTVRKTLAIVGRTCLPTA
jgi:hypothetical protein